MIMKNIISFIRQLIDAVNFKKYSTKLNGHKFVDLGLPSGLKWAAYNVGATSPSEVGNFYAWGEIYCKSEFLAKNSLTRDKEYGDISGLLQNDAARANWGMGWRMPTRFEFEELMSECSWEIEIQNKRLGYKCIGKNGNSIFFPATGFCWELQSVNQPDGFYWSSTPDTEDTLLSYSFGFNYTEAEYAVDWNERHYGMAIRPVTE